MVNTAVSAHNSGLRYISTFQSISLGICGLMLRLF